MTDITYIGTHESSLYLSVVIYLWPRMVVRWSIGQRIDTQLALWRLRLNQQVPFTGHSWQTFLREHNLLCSMSRRGNCHGNAVTESVFQLLKRERVRRQIYTNQQEAKSVVFDYIEMFYKPTRRHSSANGLSPVELEQRHSQRLVGV